MKLASILNENLIFTGLRGQERRDIYGEMLRRATSELPELPVRKVVDGLIEREDSLCLPYEGAALPHLRLPEFNDLHILIGVLEKPLRIKESDATPCQLVVLSLISENTSDLYLKALSAFVRYLGKAGNREKLIAAGSPAEVLEILRAADLEVRKTITAEDLMTPRQDGVRPQDALSVALDLFSREKRRILPVLDDQGQLLGEIAAREVIRRFIPEYIFMMENLNFLTSFEPFDRIFREETSHTVRDFMRPPTLAIPADMPLIQFTVPLVRDKISTIFVVDSEQKLLGELSIQNIIEKVLRG